MSLGLGFSDKRPPLRIAEKFFHVGLEKRTGIASGEVAVRGLYYYKIP